MTSECHRCLVVTTICLVAPWSQALGQPSLHAMHLQPAEACGGAAAAEGLAAELAIRSVAVRVADTAGEPESGEWHVWLVPAGHGACDLSARRGNESFELKALRFRSPVSIRKAAIRLAWVSELTPQQREVLEPEALVVSEEPEADEIEAPPPSEALETDVPRDTPPPPTPNEASAPKWVPFAMASADVTAMNEQVIGLWGLDVGIVTVGRWSALLRGFGTMNTIESDVLYDNGLGAEPADLRAYGASAAGEFRQPLGAFGLLANLGVGFLTAKERLPPIESAETASASTGALVEGLLGADWSVKRFVIRVLGGYRFVGPLDNIGGRRFSFSGPVGRLALGYRAK